MSNSNLGTFESFIRKYCSKWQFLAVMFSCSKILLIYLQQTACLFTKHQYLYKCKRVNIFHVNLIKKLTIFYCLLLNNSNFLSSATHLFMAIMCNLNPNLNLCKFRQNLKLCTLSKKYFLTAKNEIIEYIV